MVKAKVAWGLVAGLASGLAAAAAVELTRPRGGEGRLVDWQEVRRIAHDRLRRDPRLRADRRRRLEAWYAELAAEVQAALIEVVGGEPTEMPAFQALDRHAWVDVNLDILRRLVDQVATTYPLPDNLLVALGRAGIDRYLGLLLGFLASRVLGQFDPQLMGREPIGEMAHALYLVEPNVQQWQDEAGLPGDDLRRWLILHESTHAWQFAAHPWIADHMNQALSELLALAGPQRRSTPARVLALTVGLPSQWGMLRRMQATMSLVEGYSNLVMNLAGRKVLPSFEALEAAYRRRQGEKTLLDRLLLKVTGLDLKLRQYRDGEEFSRRVFEAHGMGVLNLAWESAENLPRPEELARPEAWVARVTGRDGGRRESQAPAW